MGNENQKGYTSRGEQKQNKNKGTSMLKQNDIAGDRSHTQDNTIERGKIVNSKGDNSITIRAKQLG